MLITVTFRVPAEVVARIVQGNSAAVPVSTKVAEKIREVVSTGLGLPTESERGTV